MQFYEWCKVSAARLGFLSSSWQSLNTEDGAALPGARHVHSRAGPFLYAWYQQGRHGIRRDQLEPPALCGALAASESSADVADPWPFLILLRLIFTLPEPGTAVPLLRFAAGHPFRAARALRVV